MFSASTFVCTWLESQIQLLRNREYLVEAGGHFSKRNDFAALLFIKVSLNLENCPLNFTCLLKKA